MKPRWKAWHHMKPEEKPQPVILAVDDAPETLSLLTDILENAGMTALVAHSGKGAMSLLSHVSPDLILMDALMPGMDGFETCAALKQDGAFAHIPVIFMTGLSDTEHVVRGFSSGGVDYVTKPVDPEELTARIRVHLANSRMTQSARMALDISGTPLVAVRDDGEVIWITPQASDLFRKVLPDGEMFGTHWFDKVTPALARMVENKPGKVQLTEGLSTPIVASYVGETAPYEHLIRLNDGDVSRDMELLRRAFDLTRRESEVLLWVTQGKSNRDVAGILDCSPRTVNKHLEQIFNKLNVENRTAAAMLAVRILADG